MMVFRPQSTEAKHVSPNLCLGLAKWIMGRLQNSLKCRWALPLRYRALTGRPGWMHSKRKALEGASSAFPGIYRKFGR